MTRTVLVTRHPADCRELAELWRDAGIAVRPYPVMVVRDRDDQAGFAAAAAALAEGGRPWLALASPRAPERLIRQAARHGVSGLLELPVATVGETTAEAASAAGLDVTLVGPGDGAGLAATLLVHLEPRSAVLLACGRDRRPELPRALEAAGHRVLPLVVYEMAPTPPRELPPLPPALDAVVVTSPRAARLYLDGVGGLPLPCPHWALGATTRDAAAAMGITCHIPPRPDLASLAAAVADSLQEERART